MPSITYNSPISANSTFPSIFGSYNTNGLIYSYYEAIKKIITVRNIWILQLSFQQLLLVLYQE